MKIGIDFDDVLTDTSHVLFAAMNEQLGKNVSYDEVTEYAWEPVFNISKATMQQTYRKIAQQHSFHQALPLLANAQKVLHQLKNDGHQLIIISARETAELPFTTVWLKEQGLLHLFSAVIHRPAGEHIWENYKAAMAKEFGIDIFIEDAPQNVLSVAALKIPVIVVDAKYNRDVSFPDSVIRIKNWKEILPIIRKLSK
jgi:HAD superfamily hydrolase (TIGR01509 family)